jgi:DNA adenine methylase
MHFLGGKARIASHLAPIILESNPKHVVEPFCGALHVTVALVRSSATTTVYASDVHTDLIDMWKAIKNDGWVPPRALSQDEYNTLRLSKVSSPLRTFAGYGCSFSGKWFGGYARDKTGRNYCLNAHNTIMKGVVPYLDRIVFCSPTDYSTSHKISLPPKSTVFYCDPPYANTTKPGERGAFSHAEFWEWVNGIDYKAYISEYTGPPNQPVVWTREVMTDMHTLTGKSRRTEKLFVNTRHGEVQ